MLTIDVKKKKKFYKKKIRKMLQFVEYSNIESVQRQFRQNVMNSNYIMNNNVKFVFFTKFFHFLLT